MDITWYLSTIRNRKNKSSNWFTNKNALIEAFSLAYLEIRSRNEWAINSTRNRIYSLKVFYFLLYRRRYFLFVSESRVSDDWKYVYRRLYACINTQKFKDPDSRVITSEIKNAGDARDHFTSFQSSPKINRILITKPICIQSLQHPTIAVLLI